MPYSAPITRSNPACVLLLIDQSGSMAEPYTGLADQSKARAVAGRHPQSFPPIVLNLTDGRPSDGNPLDHAKAIGRVTTADGTALLFNLLLSAQPTLPLCFPADERLLTDTWSKLLFRMSSP